MTIRFSFLLCILISLCYCQLLQSTFSSNGSTVGTALIRISGNSTFWNFNLFIESNLSNVTEIIVQGASNDTINYQFPQFPLIQNRVIVNQSTLYTNLRAQEATLTFLRANNRSQIQGRIVNPCVTRKTEPPAWQKWVVLAVVIILLVFLIFPLPYEPEYLFLVTVLIMVFLGAITTSEFLSGFANEGLLTVAFLFPVVKPISNTGIIQFFANYVTILRKFPVITNLVIMLVCATLSIFLNNTPIVALFIPIIKDWCRKNDYSPSKFLIPMSYATIAGGMCSIIGTSTNLVVQGFLNAAGESSFGFFELGYVGFPTAFILILYCFIFSWCCLPNHKGGMFRFLEKEGKNFLSEFDVQKFPQLKGLKVSKLHTDFQVEFIEIIRTRDSIIERIVPVPPNEIIEKNDKIILSGNIQKLLTMLHTKKMTQILQEEIPLLSEKKLEEKIDVVEKEVPQSDIKEEYSIQNDTPSSEIKEIDVSIETLPEITPQEKDAITPESKEIDPSKKIVKEVQTKETPVLKPEIKIKETTKTSFWGIAKDNYDMLLKLKESIIPKDDSNTIEYFEVVLSSSSIILGKTVGSGSFQSRYSASIIALRRNDETVTNDLQNVQFKQGDTILLLAKSSFYTEWIKSNDFYVISRHNVDSSEKKDGFEIRIFKNTINLFWWQYLSIPIFIGMIIAAALDVPMVTCALVALCIQILARMISSKEAIESVSWDLIILIGCSFGVGRAIDNSGLASTLANLILSIPFPPFLFPGVVFFLTQVISAVVTNNAAAAIMFPISINLARIAGSTVKPFAVAVAIASSADFATPIGYQTNLMVQGPGGYRFIDYVKFGLPLNVMYLIVCSILIPLIWR